MVIAEWLFPAVRLLPFRPGALDLRDKKLRHPLMAVALGERASFLEHFHRARHLALGEIHTGLAEDARVALAMYFGIHDRTSRR